MSKETEWVSLIVTRPDGKEDCIYRISGEDELSRKKMEVSMFSVEGNSYFKGLIAKNQPIIEHRFESLTFNELIERGFVDTSIL